MIVLASVLLAAPAVVNVPFFATSVPFQRDAAPASERLFSMPAPAAPFPRLSTDTKQAEATAPLGPLLIPPPSSAPPFHPDPIREALIRPIKLLPAAQQPE